MSEQNPQDKKYVTEWSFSFDKLGESINRLLGSVGVSEAEVKQASYTEPVGGAIAARIKLGPAVGQISVNALAASDNLFEAEVSYVGEIEYSVTGDAEKTIRLGQKTGPIGSQVKAVLNQVANRDDLYLKVGISPNVPVKLDLDGGVGVSRLDLSGLRLTEVEIDGGVGETFLTLPAGDSRYVAKIDGGVGATHVTIADGAALNLRLEGGVGGIDIHVPANAAVRVEAEGGVGGVSVPGHFNRVRGGDGFIGMNGVWETTGFNLAATQIYIHFSGGVGGLKIV
ncbi:MAG: hypothetical protein HZC41_03955 [Chloroflexi bacterium]|nr:hypothetical protein [Chloroflexota bacterium]